jgi:peptide/nickel transport system permease protein
MFRSGHTDPTLGEVDRGQTGYWKHASSELRRDWVAMLGLTIVISLSLVAVFAPLLAPGGPIFQYRAGLTVEGDPLPPGGDFLLGTDFLGRDEFSRLLYGARVSLFVGLGANLIAAAIGILVGGIAGMSRGILQTIIMRGVDVVIAFPILLLAITILAVTEASLFPIIAIIGLSFGAYLSRIVFSQVVSLNEREFVLAAKTSGVGNTAILFRHIVPHVMPSVIVFGTLGVATAIMLEASLSYVGVGVEPPNPSWGNMLSEGQTYMVTAPWLIALPGAAIVLTMVGFSLLGDGLRDALDPTLERRAALLIGNLH